MTPVETADYCLTCYQKHKTKIHTDNGDARDYKMVDNKRVIVNGKPVPKDPNAKQIRVNIKRPNITCTECGKPCTGVAP